MCVLIVEDEFLVRTILAEGFENAGFEVLQAQDSDRAVALIEEPPKLFSLMITDIHMPGHLDGIGVGRLMRARHPAVPIIYVSGRLDASPSADALGDHDRFVGKPFSLHRLVSLARQLIVQSPSPPQRTE